MGGGRWLADGSGLVVVTGDGYGVISAGDGRFQPLNFGGAPEQAPLPAPDDPARFAMGRLQVYSSDAGQGHAAAVPGVHPSHLEPWGLSSRELRFSTIPQPDHDGLCDPERVLASPGVELLGASPEA